MSKPVLTIIQVTHASMAGFEKTGLLPRHRRLLEEYARTFDVVVHSSDNRDYSAGIGVAHRPMRWLPRRPWLRHAAYYMGLVLRAPRMKGVIKVFGSNIPTLPLVKWLSGCPMAVTYQFDYAAEVAALAGAGSFRARLATLAEWLSLMPADVVYATTERLRARVADVYRRPAVLLPNWADGGGTSTPEGGPAGSPAGGRSASTGGREPHLVLYAGRLQPAKGLDDLITAFAGVRLRHPKARLEILGDGEDRGRLESLVTSLGLDHAALPGVVDHPEAVARMRQAAVFVLPTRTREGHPKALLEAMASGAACVATDVPGNRDLVEDGVTGLLVQPENPESLGDAIARLLADPALRERLGRAAREKTAGCDFQTIVSRDVEILLGLARRSGRAAGDP